MDYEPQFPVHFGPFTPADYLALVVLPSLAEFMEKPDDRRRAYIACIVAAHIIDHVARELKSHEAKIRQAIASQGDWQAGCLAIVEGICNGTKHAGPGRFKDRTFPFAPGQEQFISSLLPGSPQDGTTASAFLPGFIVNAGKGDCFIDDCVRAVVRAFIVAYPVLFSRVDVTSTDLKEDRWSALYPACNPISSPG